MGAQPFVSLQRSAGNRAVQRLAADGLAGVDGEAISARIGAAEGSGSSRDGAVRQRLTETLDADPGDIRIHADSEGHELSQALGAKAFTSGRDIFFQSGTFDPSTPEGFELLVHESTHVLQQAAGPVAGNATADGALAISDPGDAFEQAASSNAEAPAPAGPLAEGRSVQRWPDVNDLLGVAEQQAKGPGPTVDMLGSFTSAISDDASSGNLGMGTVKKIAATEEKREAAKGAELKESQKGFDSDVDAATKWMGGGSVDRFAGGVAKEVFGMGAGIESIIQNPIGFEKGQAEKQSKEALPMVTNQYFDTLGKVSRGEEGLGGAASELYGAFTKGKDNEWAAKQAAAQPIVNDINKGDYAGAFGRFGAEVGVAVLGMGEEGPLGEVGAEASAAEAPAVASEEGGQIASKTAGEVAPATTGPKTLPGVAPDPNPLPDLGPATTPEGPSTLPGVAPDPNPLPDLGPATVPDPATVPGLGPDLGPATVPDPATVPGLGPDLGPPTVPDPATVPGLGSDLGPATVPEGPSTLPGVAPDPNPLPDLAPDTNPSTLESPTEFQGEPTPGQSPLAKSVRDPAVGDPAPSPNPEGDGPLTQRSAGNEAPEPPAPEPAAPDAGPQSDPNGPTTADGAKLESDQDQFDAAWAAYSKEPFGYGLLPGWKPGAP